MENHQYGSRREGRFLYDVKHDGRHKERYAVDAYKTDISLDSIYSGVATLQDLRMVIFLLEINGLDIWVICIWNAYLQAKAKENM